MRARPEELAAEIDGNLAAAEIHRHGLRMPTEARACLEQRHIAGAVEQPGGSGARDAAADDYDGGSLGLGFRARPGALRSVSGSYQRALTASPRTSGTSA